MKTILCLLLLTATVGAQTVVPVTMTVTIPQQSNTVNVIPSKVLMTNNIISPQGPGVRLVKRVTAPTAFTLGVFPKDSELLLLIQNPGLNKMVWPTNIVVVGGHLPTNQANAAIVFDEIMGTGVIWASPSTP